jgi:MFS family permease
MLVLRFIFGVLIGYTMPLSSILLSETSPKEVRGRYLVWLHFFYQCGKIYLICLCFIFLEDYSHGNWRSLILFNVIPSTICFVFSIILLNESPRLYLVHHEYKEAFSSIDQIGIINKGDKYHNLSN